MERDRFVPDPTGPLEPLGVRILNPTSDQTVVLPGELPVRVEVTGTGDLLDSVGVRIIRFSTLTPVRDTVLRFDPPEGDTLLMLIFVLEAFPTNTQLNLQARAVAHSRATASAEVPVIVIDCSTGGFEFCP